MGPPDSNPVPRVRFYSGTKQRLAYFHLQDYHLLWPPFPRGSVSIESHMLGPTTPEGKPSGLGYSLFARRYWGSRFCFLFLQVLRCFTSLRSPRSPLVSVHGHSVILYSSLVF